MYNNNSSLPAGCSPTTSSVLAAQLCPGCGSNHRCTGSCSCQNLLSLWCTFSPPGSFAWPSLDEQSLGRRGISSPMLSVWPCSTDYWNWKGWKRKLDQLKRGKPVTHSSLAAIHSPDSHGIAEQSELPLGFMSWQKLIEVSILHVLCDHTERITVDAHCQETNDVWVLQTGHDLYLFQEVISNNGKTMAYLNVNR